MRGSYLTESEKQHKYRSSRGSDAIEACWLRTIFLDINEQTCIRGPRTRQSEMADIQLLDEQEVSRRVECERQHARYWRACGDGPNYVKLGRLVRYDAVA